MKECPECNEIFEDEEMEVCPTCGEKLINYIKTPEIKKIKSSIEETPMVNCPYCGNQYSSNSLNCPSCGKKQRAANKKNHQYND